jgi:putative tricarboxylic transport membrane protein
MMQDTGEPTESRGGVTYWTMDLVVAAILMAVGAVVMVSSYGLGAGWSSTGPESGYFPFYIGALILFSSTATLLITLFTKSPDRTPFVEPERFRRVLQVLIPSFIFAFAIDYIGIYVAGGLFIACFMWWLGKYSLPKTIMVGVLVPLTLFVVFEVWFLVPLPKGPLEAYFGY